jgi:phenylacetate-CoA ligase
MSSLEAIYLKLPIPLQHAACSLEGRRIKRSRFGSAFSLLLEQAEARTFWSEGQLSRYRDQRLRDFVDHCARTVPFYRRRFQESGISPGDIRTIDDLRHLPIITKREVQENCAQFVSDAISDRREITHTSGTTGAGLRFFTTMRAVQEQWAAWWRYRRWHGIELGTWCGHFAGRLVAPVSQAGPPFWRYNYPGRQIFFSGHHMSPANMASYVEELRRRQPPWLHGYPSLIALLAGYVLDTGRDLGYQLRWITLGAENLMPQQASLIERAFGVKPRQHYGMAEAVANISECERGVLHVDEDFAGVEFLSGTDGKGLKIVGTNFSNRATPLLRYEMGDMATMSDRGCSCGRPGRVVAGIDGRLEDYIVLKNGTKLGRLDHLFKDMINIREAQIRQRSRSELLIRIVPGDRYTDADERTLLRETRLRVGENVEIEIERVEKIERTANGKLRFVVSEVRESQYETY